MENHDIAYFRNLWQTSNLDLENRCKNWEEICNDNEIPEEVNGEIRTTIGLARLLMNQKLKQFNGLIDDSEFNRGEKEITCLDLQGFWDMVYFEIEKIHKCFSKLDQCKDNEWKFVEENIKQPMRKKVPVTKDFTLANKKNDSSKSHALAAKQRLAEAKKKILAQRMQEKKQDLIKVNHLNTEGLNEIQNPVSINAEQNSSATELPGQISTTESNKKLKREVDHEKVTKSIGADESTNETEVRKSASKKKSLQKKEASVQNKENLFSNDKIPTVKNVPMKVSKSIGKTEASAPTKNGRKSKEVIKLQCITRSAKKAMLAKQNTA